MRVCSKNKKKNYTELYCQEKALRYQTKYETRNYVVFTAIILNWKNMRYGTKNSFYTRKFKRL